MRKAIKKERMDRIRDRYLNRRLKYGTIVRMEIVPVNTKLYVRLYAVVHTPVDDIGWVRNEMIAIEDEIRKYYNVIAFLYLDKVR